MPKGPIKVAGLLSNYIEKYILCGPHIKKKKKKKLKIFADKCYGQNKKHAIMRFIVAVVSVSKFDRVELLYPIRGHSFMPCDREVHRGTCLS